MRLSIFIVLVFFVSLANAKEVDNSCSLGLSYGVMLPPKDMARVSTWQPVRTWSRTGAIAHMRTKEKGQYKSATEMSYANVDGHENYFLNHARSLANKYGHKCFGVANVTHDFVIDEGNITLYSYGDAYTVK